MDASDKWGQAVLRAAVTLNVPSDSLRGALARNRVDHTTISRLEVDEFRAILARELKLPAAQAKGPQLLGALGALLAVR
jgi:hypothetical protein